MLTPLVDENYLPFLMNALDNAHKKVYAIIYFFWQYKQRKHDDAREIMLKIIQAHQRGLEVKILINQIIKRGLKSNQNLDFAEQLKGSGVPVAVTNTNRTTHAKLWLFDDETIIIGSHNITTSSFHKNREISLAIKDKTLNIYFTELVKKEFILTGDTWQR